MVEPHAELPYQDAIQAAAAAGDTDEVQRLAERLRHQIELVDPDDGPSERTITLLTSLLTGSLRGVGSAG